MNISLLLETFVTELFGQGIDVLVVVQSNLAVSTRTTGFEMHSCSSNIQSSSYIGFWCDWSTGDGAVMMIGGGGSGCHRADHGIGITEENAAKFGGSAGSVLDFGNQAHITAKQSYALNLWVR